MGSFPWLGLWKIRLWAYWCSLQPSLLSNPIQLPCQPSLPCSWVPLGYYWTYSIWSSCPNCLHAITTCNPSPEPALIAVSFLLSSHQIQDIASLQPSSALYSLRTPCHASREGVQAYKLPSTNSSLNSFETSSQILLLGLSTCSRASRLVAWEMPSSTPANGPLLFDIPFNSQWLSGTDRTLFYLHMILVSSCNSISILHNPRPWHLIWVLQLVRLLQYVHKLASDSGLNFSTS